MSELTDEQLVRAFQRGDEAAFSRFVARHQDRVYRLSVMWLHDAQMAGDATQEAFLRSYTGLGRFRFKAQPRTWLLRVCRNVCWEFNRRRRFEPLDDAFLDTLAIQPDHVELLAARVHIADLREAVSRLPERQRQVVTLRMFEELSVADTARVMGCRPGTVKAHLNKAISALRAKMDSRELP